MDEYEKLRAAQIQARKDWEALLDTPCPNPRDFPNGRGSYDSNALHRALDARRDTIAIAFARYEQAATVRRTYWEQMQRER